MLDKELQPIVRQAKQGRRYVNKLVKVCSRAVKSGGLIHVDRSPADRKSWKLRLVKGLYERGMDAEDVRQLLRFIDWIMDLPQELEQRFQQELTAYQQEKHMPFITILSGSAWRRACLKASRHAYE